MGEREREQARQIFDELDRSGALAEARTLTVLAGPAVARVAMGLGRVEAGRTVVDPMLHAWRIVQVSGGRALLLALPGGGTLDAALATVETWTLLPEEAPHAG